MSFKFLKNAIIQSMIEIEKKLSLTPEQEKRLIAGAEFIKEQKLLNSFYDDPNYSLTKKDQWLRDRNGRFELKMPIADRNRAGFTDQYKELENDEAIKKALGFPESEELKKILQNKGFAPFYSCLTIRREYKKDGFVIDLDLTYFEPKIIYEIAEIELLVANQEEAPAAIAKIKKFAADHDIPYGSTRGKIIEYLKRYKPAHYDALVAAGVIKDF